MFRYLCALLAISLTACASVAPASSVPRPVRANGSTIASDHAQHDTRLRASSPAATILPSPIALQLDAAALATLPRETVTTNEHGKPLRCEGIALLALLRASGAMPAEPLQGAQLVRYVLVDGRDGERVLFALAELDPTLGNRRVYLADRCDGAPAGEIDAPLRLIVPDEARPARWVREVESITVVVAP